MKNQCKQLSLFETFNECNELLLNDKPKFLQLLDEYLNLKSLIPFSFYTSYYNALGCHRKYSLWSMLSIFLLQKIFGIPTIALLRIFLQFSKELREFCGIESVPDDAQFTRFKQDFVPQLEEMFHELVDLTEPICERIDKNLASMLIYDTTGIETYVAENNDKFLNKIIRQVKASNKDKSNDHIHNIAYSRMPKVSSVNDEIRRMYANGKFCYAYKFGILTNGLGIVRDITCFDRKFKVENPELELEVMEDDPENEKTVDDSKSLKPVISNFLALHPKIKPEVFLGDAAFDTYKIYPFLLKECHFKKAFIPLRKSPKSEDIADPAFNESGWPVCPRDATKAFKFKGINYDKTRTRLKFICPDTHYKGKNPVCYCQNPCTPSREGRTVNVPINRDLRMYPGTVRDTDSWSSVYKNRAVIERTINHFKEPMGCGNPKTRNLATIKSDMLLAGITQLITVILADKMNDYELIRSLKPLIA